jgi:cupin 2 domain-containing protein
MIVVMPNIYDPLQARMPEEFAETLASCGAVRIERIVSHGHASPEGFWYDQPEHEFVILLSGGARVRFADDPEPLELRPGDYLTIAPHRRHRVEWTAPDQPSIWLAVFYQLVANS